MPCRLVFVPRHIRRRPQPALQQRVHVVGHRHEAHDEAGDRFPISRPSHSGIFSGDNARVSSTTVGYRPTQTAMDVLVSDGGGASSPCSSKANQLPNELSMVRDWKSENLLALGQQRLALRRDEPLVEVGGVVVAVQRGPFLLHTLDRAEQLGAAEAGEGALRQPQSLLPGQEVLDVLRVDPVGDDHGHQRIRLPCAPPPMTCWVPGPSKYCWHPRSSRSCRVALLIQACTWAMESKR